jgi:hypothetical protein
MKKCYFSNGSTRAELSACTACCPSCRRNAARKSASPCRGNRRTMARCDERVDQNCPF